MCWVFFFPKDKFHNITEVSSSLRAFICWVTLPLSQIKLADLTTGNKTAMIVRSSNAVNVQNNTNHVNVFKVFFILHSLIKHHTVKLNQKHKGPKLFWGIFSDKR